MLYTKCILHNPAPEDGLRISVMSRHTENDGKTPDKRITLVDEHQPALGPSSKLIGNYYKRGLSWEDFSKYYLSEIRVESKRPLVISLAEKATQEDVTILCIEETAHMCHRRLLADECQIYQPSLQVIHH